MRSAGSAIVRPQACRASAAWAPMLINSLREPVFACVTLVADGRLRMDMKRKYGGNDSRNEFRRDPMRDKLAAEPFL